MGNGYIFGKTYIRSKNKNIKKSMGLYTWERDFIFGILWYILILRFRLEIIYLDNNEYSYILLNKFFLSSVEEGIK